MSIKVALPGYKTSDSPEFLSIDSDFAIPKCDLTKNPKNYGSLNITIANVPIKPNAPQIVYQQPHGYNYVPSFLTAWELTQGTSALGNLSSTYGIGDIDATNAFIGNPGPSEFGYGPYVAMYCDNQNFYISAQVQSTNASPPAVTNFQFNVRFYIFADDFSGV